MNRDCFKLLLYIILLKISFILLIKADIADDTWMDPDAWARDHLASGDLQSNNGKCCKCLEQHLNSKEYKDQQHILSEDTASIIYFKKFIAMLFDRKRFKYDSTQKLYKRSIVFTTQSYQMDKLEQLQDPRDLDSILTEILKNACDGQQLFHTRETSDGISVIVYNILIDVWQLVKLSEVRFLLIVTIVILLAWAIHKRFKIGWLPLIFGGIFIYGYLHTYVECNREIEVNRMLEFLKHNENKAEGSKISKFFKGILYSDDDQVSQQQNLKKSAKLSLGFCRPDHVIIMYFNDIFIRYIQVLIEQCTVTLTTLNGTLGFPYNILSGFIVVYLILYILKLTFKYLLSPSAWSHFMYRKHSCHSGAAMKSTINSQGDHISGDNLKLLLSATSAALQRIAVGPTMSAAGVSGIEDLREAIEPSLEKSLPEVNEGASEKIKNNVSNKNSLDEENDIKIEDICENS